LRGPGWDMEERASDIVQTFSRDRSK
jgi:hypothetical protein